jgi:hypothetical protein
VAHALHDLEVTRAGDAGQLGREFRCRREVVLAGQQIERALSVEAGEIGVPQIAVSEIVVQVAQEDRGPALHVVPQRLPLVGAGRGRCDQAGDRAGRGLLTVDVRPEHHAEIAQPRVGARLGVRRRLQADSGAEMCAMAQRQMQDGAAADRAAHHHRTSQAERPRHRHHRVDIELRRQLVRLGLEAGRR